MNKRISLVRKESGTNQEDFAKALGLTKNYISLVETGKREPSERTIKDICREFNVNENWLRYGEGEMFLDVSLEKEIAKLTVDLINAEDDSFQRKLISVLSRMTPEEWKWLEEKAREVVGTTKKE